MTAKKGESDHIEINGIIKELQANCFEFRSLMKLFGNRLVYLEPLRIWLMVQTISRLGTNPSFFSEFVPGFVFRIVSEFVSRIVSGLVSRIVSRFVSRFLLKFVLRTLQDSSSKFLSSSGFLSRIFPRFVSRILILSGFASSFLSGFIS